MKTRRMMLSAVWIMVSVLIFVACEKEEEKPIVEKRPFVGFIRISSQVINVPREGGKFGIQLTTNVPWKATADQPWVTLPTEGGGTVNSPFGDDVYIEIDVDKNTTLVQDTAHVVFVEANINPKCESVACTIIRKAKLPFLWILGGNREVGPDKSTFSVRVQANMAWTATADQPWVTLSLDSGKGDETLKTVDTVTVTVAENLTFTNDRATVKISLDSTNKVETFTISRYGQPYFSVSATKKVQFSKGNLQYHARNNVWRFAENQYDIIGKANENISSTYNGWIDLFCYGTSGYKGRHPWTVGNESYCRGLSYDFSGTNYDWGVYNAISNGGNKAGMWRTLTMIEWKYLFWHRPRSLIARARVNNVNGFIIFPDNRYRGDHNEVGCYDYTAKDWSSLEKTGAVFLPAAGSRRNRTFKSLDTPSQGYYWAAEPFLGYFLYFRHEDCGDYYNVYPDGQTETDYDFQYQYGYSVRLVQDCQDD